MTIAIPKLPHHKTRHTWRGKKRYHLTPAGMLPGVTTILEATKTESDRKSLDKWREKVGDEEADRICNESKERGTWLHQQIESTLKGESIELEDANPLIGFWESIQPALEMIATPLLIESAVWHPLSYAGTFDCLAVDHNGDVMLCDWKTSSKTKDEAYVLDYMLQIGAYSQAIDWMYEEYGISVQRALIAIALPSKPCQLFEMDQDDLIAFQHAWRLRLKSYRHE